MPLLGGAGNESEFPSLPISEDSCMLTLSSPRNAHLLLPCLRDSHSPDESTAKVHPHAHVTGQRALQAYSAFDLCEDIDMSTWQKLSAQELNMRIWRLSTVVHSSGSDPSWTGAEISLGLRFLNRLSGGMCVQDYDSRTIGGGENLGEALAALRSLVPPASEE